MISVSIIREKGYAATSVDELCAGAGVTKGAFFHHFPSKDSLAVAAANHWSELSNAHTQAVLQARSSWLRPRATPRWLKRASITCVAMSNCCPVVRRKRPAGRAGRTVAG